MNKENEIIEEFINLRGGIVASIIELKAIDEKQCSIGAWNSICNAISCLESVYEGMK